MGSGAFLAPGGLGGGAAKATGEIGTRQMIQIVVTIRTKTVLANLTSPEDADFCSSYINLTATST